jgi:hypothetical protein
MPLKYSIAQMRAEHTNIATNAFHGEGEFCGSWYITSENSRMHITRFASRWTATFLRCAFLISSRRSQLAGEKTAKAIGKIFASTLDDEVRTACLAGLYKIDNTAARNELFVIRGNERHEARWRTAAADYLEKARAEGKQIPKRDAAFTEVH